MTKLEQTVLETMKGLEEELSPFIFENNNEYTRRCILDCINKYMYPILARGRIRQYQIFNDGPVFTVFVEDWVERKDFTITVEQ